MPNSYATIRDPQDPTKRKPVPLTNGRYTGGVPEGWSDFELEKEAPSIVRDGDGLAVQKPKQNLQSMLSQGSLINAAKELMRMKSNANQDITKARTYWRTLMRDTSPFGGKRDPSLTGPGFFEDEELRQLSPEQQASIRASRGAAAQAHLQGLSEEERFRGQRSDDVIKALTEMRDQQSAEAKDARDRVSQNLDDALKLQKLPGYITDRQGNIIRDLSSADVNTIADTIKEIESSNNYQAKGASGEFGAYQFMPGTWNQYSQEYMGANGIDSGMSFNPTPENQDAVAKFKIQQWLDKGYKPDQIAAAWNSGEGNLGKDYSQIVGTNEQGVDYSVPNYVNRFKDVLAAKMPQETEGFTLTEAKKTGIMQQQGWTNEEVEEMGLTEDDWIIMERVIRDKSYEKALEMGKEMVAKEDRPATKPIIDKLKFNFPALTNDDISMILSELGFTYKFSDLQGEYTFPSDGSVGQPTSIEERKKLLEED